MSSRIPQVNNQDKDFQLYQTQLQKTLQPLTSNPMNYGNILTGIALAAGQTSVSHKLNRAYQGWIIVDINGASSVYSSTSSDPTKFLVLNSSAAVTVSLLVF